MASRLSAQSGVVSSNTLFQVYVEVDGVLGWHQIPGASGFSYTHGTRPINETEVFGDTYTETGELTKPDLNITIASYIPHSPVMEAIVGKHEDEETLDVRWTFPGKVVFQQTTGAPTIDIATNGDVTFNSVPASQLLELGSKRVAENMMIFTGSSGSYRDFQIRSKTVSDVAATRGQATGFNVVDAATRAFPASALSDENFGVRIASLQTPSLSCDIMEAGGEDGSSSTAGLGSSLVFKGRHQLGRRVIVSN